MIEDLLQQIAQHQLRVNNLFQLDDGKWQANLTDGERVWNFGLAFFPEAALQAAFQAALTDQGRETARKQNLRNERQEVLTQTNTSAEEMGL